jgi:hypothetical protein
MEEHRVLININPEILTADIDTTASILLSLFGKIWRQEKIPQERKCGQILRIPKKWDRTECSNWRGISLLSIPGKVFTRVILNRAEAVIESHLRREQAGFRKNRSCIDHINTLHLILEQHVEWNTTLYSTFKNLF